MAQEIYQEIDLAVFFQISFAEILEICVSDKFILAEELFAKVFTFPLLVILMVVMC